MSYWLHRCRHEGGFNFLDNEKRLTIGFSDCAVDDDMVKCIHEKNGDDFDRFYKEIYGGDIWKQRWSLWYFACEMEAGDIVVVPRDGGFTLCKLVGNLLVSEHKKERDIGFEWGVEILASCYPREAYASTGLLSRMKCRQTTLNISDLQNDIDTALERYRNSNPFSLPTELAKKCHELLDAYGSPDHFEQLLLDYFIKLGAQAEILPKNYSSKVGDCDISAVFPALRLPLSVQAKKHWGTTDDWGVQQIVEYAKDRSSTEDANWTYANWVVSFASDFSEEAKKMAQENGVVLLNGDEFCRMIISNGIGLG